MFGFSSEQKTTEIAVFLLFYLSLWELLWGNTTQTHTLPFLCLHTQLHAQSYLNHLLPSSSGFTDIFWDYSIQFRVIEEQGDGEHVITLCLVESGIVNAQHTQRWEIQHHLHSKDLICHTAKNKVLHWIDMLTGDKHLVTYVWELAVWQQIEMPWIYLGLFIFWSWAAFYLQPKREEKDFGELKMEQRRKWMQINSVSAFGSEKIDWISHPNKPSLILAIIPL